MTQMTPTGNDPGMNPNDGPIGGNGQWPDDRDALVEALYQAAQMSDMLTNDLEGLNNRWYGGKRWKADIMAARDTSRQLRRAAWAVKNREPGALR